MFDEFDYNLFRQYGNELNGNSDLELTTELRDNVSQTHTEDGVPIRKLYAGNLPKNAHQNEVKKVFEKYGEVEDIIIRKSPKHRFAYAFVTFSDTNDAIKVLNDKNRIIFSFKKLQIHPADSWHQPDFAKKINKDPQEREKSSTETEKPEAHVFSETDPTLDCLNDDCMLYILNMLPLKDRIVVERVSKRWRTLCHVLWNQQRVLCVNSDSWSSWHLNFTTQRLRSVLIRCGHSLKTLDISEKTSKLNSRTLQIIGKCCPNIENLNISGLTVSCHATKLLASCCKNLREISMEHCPGITDNELKPILLANENIEVLNLSRNSKLTGSCFDYLKPSIKHINVMNCTSLEGERFAKNLQNFKNLQRLNLDSCVTLRNYTIKNIVESVPHLQHLSLSNDMPLVDSQGTSFLNRLENLVSLNLSLSCSVNDNTLTLISKSCLKLEMLDLTCCREDTATVKSLITNSGIGALANLPNLKTLFISYLNFSDNGLISLSASKKLTKLQCRGCPWITDSGAISIIDNCEDLTDFDVSGCDLITRRTVDYAAHVIETWKDNLPLCLYVGGTCVLPDQIPKSLPTLLKVSLIDLSVKHLRPDFSDELFSNSDVLLDEDWPSDDESGNFNYALPCITLNDDQSDWGWENEYDEDDECDDEDLILDDDDLWAPVAQIL